MKGYVSVANTYKKTMNLPKTPFKMKANLAQREPDRLKKWEKMDLYHEVLKANEGHESYILHDGPPYANGPIHIGHALNKVLKDFIVKYKAQQGYYTPYIPGWDCHGLPIENKVEDQLGPEKMKRIDTATFRKICREYAEKQVDRQREGFKRLGVGGEWDDPYLTFTPEYETGNIEVFKELYLSGAIYRGRKPIHWCSHCHTALAEAELEYSDEVSPAIFVRFELTTCPDGLEAYDGSVDVAIWTTTPWTLPADQAVILHPEADYVAVLHDGRPTIFAEALAEKCCEKFGWDCELAKDADGETWKRTGTQLAGNLYKQPIFADQGETGSFIYADYVTLDDGTGIVHSAPGHGVDDYNAGIKFGVPLVMPVDDNGCFFEGTEIGTGGPWGGMEVHEADPKIIEWLDERGLLIMHEDIDHSYPHCWRCKEPVIFRATTQWFVSMDKTSLREKAADQIGNHVRFIPEWASNRIGAMVAERPDWCISRQRFWGVPIPVFYCDDCGEVIANEESFDAIIELFRTKGADAWYTVKPEDFLPESVVCPKCGGRHLTGSKDVLDVWWESGVSHTSVCEARDQLHRPADLYLEGSDQHRGWFQSSLLTSVGAYGVAPYNAVMSCGFTVDGDGHKMSKSLGNTIDPEEVNSTYGADVLRLWVASVDYSHDMGINSEILDRTAESYRSIRNNFRFLLSNLNDFAPSDAVAWDDMPDIDRWAMARLDKLLKEVTDAWDNYLFHVAYRLIIDYTNELSKIYLDMLKDRLYSEAPDSVARRSAQTVVYNVLEVLVRIWAPVLTFTCDEAWEYYPDGIKEAYAGDIPSVQLAGWPDAARFTPQVPADEAAKLLASYETVLAVREVVTKALEETRKEGGIGKSQEAAITVTCPQEIADILNDCGPEALSELFIVSDVHVHVGDGETTAEVSEASGEKCERCWNYREIGNNPDYPDLCDRCAEVVASMEE